MGEVFVAFRITLFWWVRVAQVLTERVDSGAWCESTDNKAKEFFVKEIKSGRIVSSFRKLWLVVESRVMTGYYELS